ncbi:PhoH family protein [Sulfuriroseicoccus oceanibius]|uniref:PhoH-like protein n=1 Tax=Sulfuriroseicoccus oceanibius TaxID=2707525 RepID=A0A6B3L902_9BACT|nr:PhoH family protein [Sulfuriroseicoccus oceanibius]QQL44355.1 PhoH family protein [Sulfuriroseicoccus oceanibius]
MVKETVSFESSAFLHALFGNSSNELRRLQDAFGVKAAARGSDLVLHGPEAGVERVIALFASLEKSMRQGGEVTAEGFRMAVAAMSEGQGSADDATVVTRMQLVGGQGKPAVRARTRKQLEYLQAMDEHHVVFGLGAAGTGKTYLAVAKALDEIRQGNYRRLVLTRPAVEAGEALGFLPGDLKEKIYPYLRPLYDALYDMGGAEEIEKFVERGQIEVAPLAYMRGRTLNDSFVILDEAQNTTREQMLMFLTRMGEESRCVVTGDPSQIDLKGKQGSGLVEARRILKGVEGIGFVEFERQDVVRHPVVQRIIDAYERHRPGGEGKEGSTVDPNGSK